MRRRVAAYLLVLVLAAGCTLGELFADYGDPVELSAAEVVGTWTNPSRRTITFHEDGTFTATNLPDEAFIRSVPTALPATPSPGASFYPLVPLDGAGTWAVAGSHIRLSVKRLGGFDIATGHSLDVLRENDVVLLYFFYVGNGGNSWTSYEKCADPCDPLTGKGAERK